MSVQCMALVCGVTCIFGHLAIGGQSVDTKFHKIQKITEYQAQDGLKTKQDGNHNNGILLHFHLVTYEGGYVISNY